MSGKRKENGHDKNYAIRVLAYTLYCGFNGLETIIIAYMTYYLTNSLFLSAGIVGGLVAVAKLFDGVSDIVAGFLIDHTHTRWGKARPYGLFAIAMWITVVLLFSTPVSWSTGAKCVYVFIMYLLTDTVFRTLVLAADPVHYRHGFNKKEQMDSVAIWGTVGGAIAIVGSIAIPILVNVYQFQDHGWTIIAAALAVPAAVFSSLKVFCIPET